MIAPTDARMISTADYSRKYNANRTTVARWASEGRLYGFKQGRCWVVADEPAKQGATTSARDKFSGGKIKCGTCRRRLSRHAYSDSDSGMASGRCIDCTNYLQRKRFGSKTPATISYGLDLEVWRELENMPEEIRRDRAAKMRAHAERIEAMGLAGDGKDWPDGE